MLNLIEFTDLKRKRERLRGRRGRREEGREGGREIEREGLRGRGREKSWREAEDNQDINRGKMPF